MFYAYVYRDPERGLPIYVGKGCGKRLHFHLTKATNIRLRNRLIALQALGLKPIIEKIEATNEESALVEEVRLIKLYGRKDLGTGSLYNMTDGGEGMSGWRPTEETKRKIGEANRNGSPATKQKQSEWVRDSELCEKISRSRKLTELTMSEEKRALRAKHLSIECLSKETRRKMSISAKARPALTCPHCGKVGKVPGIRRHHFEYCRTLNKQY